DAGGRHEPARAHLVAHLLDHLPGGPDEDEPGVRAGLGEAPVLREEAVAGMDGLDSDAPGDIEDALDVEIALARRGGADGHGLTGLGDEWPRPVSLGVHGDRPDPERTAGADDATGDLAPVGDEDARQHRIRRGAPCPRRRGAPPPRASRPRRAPSGWQARPSRPDPPASTSPVADGRPWPGRPTGGWSTSAWPRPTRRPPPAPRRAGSSGECPPDPARPAPRPASGPRIPDPRRRSSRPRTARAGSVPRRHRSGRAPAAACRRRRRTAARGP